MKNLQVNVDFIVIVKNVDDDTTFSGVDFIPFSEESVEWFKRMVGYGFVENTDFVLVSEKTETNNPKNPFTTITDHALKLDIAKEISMIQRNEKGSYAERYKEGKRFIKLEGEQLLHFRKSEPQLQVSNMARVLYLWTD